MARRPSSGPRLLRALALVVVAIVAFDFAVLVARRGSGAREHDGATAPTEERTGAPSTTERPLPPEPAATPPPPAVATPPAVPPSAATTTLPARPSPAPRPAGPTPRPAPSPQPAPRPPTRPSPSPSPSPSPAPSPAPPPTAPPAPPAPSPPPPEPAPPAPPPPREEVPPAPPPEEPPPGRPGPRHGSIVEYLEGARTGEVIVPNGVYEGGAVAASRPGWLVLRAETPGGVTVDLRSKGLQLDDPTNKVVFVGFRFVNGMVRLAGVSDVHFWYCRFTFPPEEWTRQYRAAGGPTGGRSDRDVRQRYTERMANPFPTALRIRSSLRDPGRHNRRIGIYGSDISDVGDDGVFFGFARGVRLAGLRIWNVDERGQDPGRELDNDQDWWHNDGIQTVGAIEDVEISDSWIGQKVQWSTEGRDILDARFQRLWLAGSRTFGQINGLAGGRILRNVQEDITVFGNGQQGGRHTPDLDRFRVDIVDGEQRAVWSAQHHDPGRFEIRASRVSDAVPAGVTVRNGILVDLAQVRDHPQNPANRWRSSYPYGSYRQHLGIR